MSRALVFGGGSLNGMAWQIGVLAGLTKAGFDPGGADLVIGTSSGAVVAAHVAQDADILDVYATRLRGPEYEIPARMTLGTQARLGWGMLRAKDPEDFRGRAGRLARAAGHRRAAERRAVLEARLPYREWPRRRLLVTAVDATSGTFTTFDRSSGVPLLDAVLASGALPGVWPPVEIQGRLWIDGALRSYTNADLAAGVDQLVVLAPKSRRLGPIAGVRDDLARLGPETRAVVITPDRAAREAIGRNAMDPRRQTHAARAGMAQTAGSAAEAYAAISACWAS